MSRFGRISGNYVIDVYDANTAAELEKSMGVTGFIAVPASTLSGDSATQQADGSYTFQHQASAAPVAPGPRTLTKTEFRAYAVSKLGGGLTGMARFQDIMDAAEAATGFVKFCFTQYHDAADILRDDLAGFLDIMVSAKIVTQAEHDAVIGGWPTE